jgi:hypothetical protein
MLIMAGDRDRDGRPHGHAGPRAKVRAEGAGRATTDHVACPRPATCRDIPFGCPSRHMAATRAGRVPQPIYAHSPRPARPAGIHRSPRRAARSAGGRGRVDGSRAGRRGGRQRERELVSPVRSLSAPRLLERRAGARRHLWPWPLDVRAGARLTFFLPPTHPIIRPIDPLRASAVPRRWSLAGSAATVSPHQVAGRPVRNCSGAPPLARFGSVATAASRSSATVPAR